MSKYSLCFLALWVWGCAAGPCLRMDKAVRKLTNNEEGPSYIHRITSRASFGIPRVVGDFWHVPERTASDGKGHPKLLLRRLSIETDEGLYMFEDEFARNTEMADLGAVPRITLCFYDADNGFGYFLLPNMPVNLGFADCMALQECAYEAFILLTPVQRLHIYSKVAAKLAQLHEAGLVHGNLRPEKILFAGPDFAEPFLEFWASEPTLPETKKDGSSQDPYRTINQIIEYHDLDLLVCLRRALESSKEVVTCMPPTAATDIYALLITIHKIERYVNWRSPDLVFSELSFRKVPQSEFFTKIRAEALSFANYWRSSILLCVKTRTGEECVHRILAQMGVMQRENRLISARRIADVFARFRDYQGEFLGPDFDASETFDNAVNDRLVPVLYDPLA